MRKEVGGEDKEETDLLNSKGLFFAIKYESLAR